MNSVPSKGDSWSRRGAEGRRTQSHPSLGLEHPGLGAPSNPGGADRGEVAS